MEAQVSLTVAFSSSAFVGLLIHIFLLTIPIDSLWGSGLVSLLATPTSWSFLTNFWCFWQCGQVPNPAGKNIFISVVQDQVANSRKA